MLKLTRKRGSLIMQEPIKKFDREVFSAARENLVRLQDKDVVRGGFDSDRWTINNQIKRTVLPFDYKKEELQEVCRQERKRYAHVIKCMKTYMALRIQVASPENLRSEVRYFISELINSRMGTVSVIPPVTNKGHDLFYYIEFLSIYGVSQEYLYTCRIEMLHCRDEQAAAKKDEQHAVSMDELLSYLKFDDVVRKWWKGSSFENLRGVYYPLYLWWVITSIIPLRVREFCSTAFDCVKEEGGLYYLTVRRSKLKGSSAHAPVIRQHRIDADNSEHTYEIPRWLFEEIKEYQELTEGYEHPYGLLFSIDHINSCDNRILRTANADKAFGPVELAALIRDFYARIVLGQYGYELVDAETLMSRSIKEGSYALGDNEIMLVQARHTRHLAMINLVMRGATPMVLKAFAIHTNDKQDAHYYGNVTKLVRCTTKYYYEKYKRNQAILKEDLAKQMTFALDSLNIDDRAPYIEVDSGRCYNPSAVAGTYKDCKKYGGDCEKCGWHKGSGKKVDEQDIDQEMEHWRKLLTSDSLDEKIEEFQVRTNALEMHLQDFATQIWKELQEKDMRKEKVYEDKTGKIY